MSVNVPVRSMEGAGGGSVTGGLDVVLVSCCSSV